MRVFSLCYSKSDAPEAFADVYAVESRRLAQ
jgi:hypothetical protein